MQISVTFRLAWSTEWVPGQPRATHRIPVSEEEEERKEKEEEEKEKEEKEEEEEEEEEKFMCTVKIQTL